MGFPNFSLSHSAVFALCLFSLQIITGYAEFLYQIGLLDERQKKYFQKHCDECVKYIKEKKWFAAFEVSPGACTARSNENQLRRVLQARGAGFCCHEGQ